MLTKEDETFIHCNLLLFNSSNLSKRKKTKHRKTSSLICSIQLELCLICHKVGHTEPYTGGMQIVHCLRLFIKLAQNKRNKFIPSGVTNHITDPHKLLFNKNKNINLSKRIVALNESEKDDCGWVCFIITYEVFLLNIILHKIPFFYYSGVLNHYVLYKITYKKMKKNTTRHKCYYSIFNDLYVLHSICKLMYFGNYISHILLYAIPFMFNSKSTNSYNFNQKKKNKIKLKAQHLI